MIITAAAPRARLISAIQGRQKLAIGAIMQGTVSSCPAEGDSGTLQGASHYPNLFQIVEKNISCRNGVVFKRHLWKLILQRVRKTNYKFWSAKE